MPSARPAFAAAAITRSALAVVRARGFCRRPACRHQARQLSFPHEAGEGSRPRRHLHRSARARRYSHRSDRTCSAAKGAAIVVSMSQPATTLKRGLSARQTTICLPHHPNPIMPMRIIFLIFELWLDRCRTIRSIRLPIAPDCLSGRAPRQGNAPPVGRQPDDDLLARIKASR